MQLETTKGTFEDSDLAVEFVPFDVPTMFAMDRIYRLPGQPDVIAVYRDVKFHKVNPFEAVETEVYTAGGPMVSTELLDKTLGTIDNDNEFSCWVEYRLKGQPDSEPVHRSMDVKLKRSPPLGAVLGKIG